MTVNRLDRYFVPAPALDKLPPPVGPMPVRAYPVAPAPGKLLPPVGPTPVAPTPVAPTPPPIDPTLPIRPISPGFSGDYVYRYDVERTPTPTPPPIDPTPVAPTPPINTREPGLPDQGDYARLPDQGDYARLPYQVNYFAPTPYTLPPSYAPQPYMPQQGTPVATERANYIAGIGSLAPHLLIRAD